MEEWELMEHNSGEIAVFEIIDLKSSGDNNIVCTITANKADYIEKLNKAKMIASLPELLKNTHSLVKILEGMDEVDTDEISEINRLRNIIKRVDIISDIKRGD